MRFYQSLRFKITLVFIALMIAGNSAALYLANRSVTEKYSQYVSDSDEQRASMAALFIANSWERWKSDLDRLRDDPDRDLRMRPGTGMGRSMMMDRSEPVPFAVTDGEGKVLFFSGPGGLPERKLDNFEEGVPVVVDGEDVAYVLAGTMINREMSRIDLTMLRGINRVLILTNIISTLLILASGIVLLGRMLAPLRKIDRAAADLGRGNYSARTDVSGADEIGNLGIRFDEMARSLEASEEWKRRIIADTAHELRTPVSLVLSRLEMMKDGIYAVDEKQLATLYREVENFSRLIREMQKLAGMEGGTVTLEKGMNRPGSFCLGQLLSFLPESRKKNLTLLWDGQPLSESTEPGDEESSGFRADWNRLEQVMKNLLSNALRYTPEGGIIEVKTALNDEGLFLSVSDSGPGIPEGDRARIFDRFYRLESSRNREKGGYGLGLAISRAIVEAHGGRISVEESPLGGADFKIFLPR